MNDLQDIKKEIEKIRERNARVEADKAWEVSGTRTGFIAFITYLFMVFVLYTIEDNHFLLNALISTIGFVLSVQTLPLVKRWWIKKYRGL